MLIGFTGKIGSGKTSLTRHIVLNNFNSNRFNYISTSFATPIKKILMTLGLSYEQVYGSEKEIPLSAFGGRTPRYLMQTLGTEWGRDLITPEIWINLWEKEYKNLSNHLYDVIVDDVRFPNEVERIHKLGGIIIHLSKGEVNVPSTHVSESYIFNSDYSLDTSEPIENTYREFRNIINSRFD